MEDAVLKYATAQLLTKIEDNGFEHYFSLHLKDLLRNIVLIRVL